MKKALFLVALLLMCSFVFAEQGMDKAQAANSSGQQERIQAEDHNLTPQLISAREQKENMTGPVIIGYAEVHRGLSNALQNVKNDNARQRIQANMERFLEKYQKRLGNMTDVEVKVDENTNETTIKEKKDVKFLGFIRGKAIKTYKVDNEGNMKEENPWYRFMYKE